MKSEALVIQAIDTYADTVTRICLMHLKHQAQADDAFQEVFLRYLLSDVEFADAEHEKAWLIRVTINVCKDALRKSQTATSKELALEPERHDRAHPPHHDDYANWELWQLVQGLPDHYRDAVYLHYYEGYTASLIAELLDTTENTVYTWLARARTTLKGQLEGGA